MKSIIEKKKGNHPGEEERRGNREEEGSVFIGASVPNRDTQRPGRITVLLGFNSSTDTDCNVSQGVCHPKNVCSFITATLGRCSLSDVSPPLLPLAPLSLYSTSPLPLLVWPSLAGHGVAAVWVPLHVTDTPHRLKLRATGAVLVKVSVFTLLQQELAATVSGVLIAHPAEENKEVSLCTLITVLCVVFKLKPLKKLFVNNKTVFLFLIILFQLVS